MWVVRGVSPKDTLFEIEMLLDPAISREMEGFPNSISDVKEKTLKQIRNILSFRK